MPHMWFIMLQLSYHLLVDVISQHERTQTYFQYLFWTQVRAISVQYCLHGLLSKTAL